MVKDASRRPRPKVATGKSARYNTNSGGSYKGKSGTKSPTGNRPVPQVAKDTPRFPGPPGPVKRSIRHTPMPAPNRKAGSGKSRAEGGGSY